MSELDLNQSLQIPNRWDGLVDQYRLYVDTIEQLTRIRACLDMLEESEFLSLEKRTVITPEEAVLLGLVDWLCFLQFVLFDRRSPPN